LIDYRLPFNRYGTQSIDPVTDETLTVWTSILKTTYRDNPFAGSQYEAMMQALQKTDPVYYQVYALGEWGVIKPERPFADNFNRSHHVRQGLKYEEGYDLFQLWDFNVDNTCVLAQNVYNEVGNLKIRFLKEYHKSGWDLQRICQEIRTDYPNALYKLNGDASGKAGNALTSGNQSAYDILKEEQNLSWHQFNVASVNPSHLNSRLLTNLILKTCYGPDDYLVEIDEEGCPNVIKDFERVYVDKRGSLDECKRKNPELTHFLDPCRYHFNSEHYDRIREIGYEKLMNQ
jgi:phage terminase large subunit